jgi:DNA helicase HerA-like ATPase
VQHALRAFTPRDQKAVKTAADTLRPNPKFKAEKVITELGVGEALVSLLDEKGRPTIVERAFIVPPASHTGPIGDEERRQLVRGSMLCSRYERTIDRESAHEKLRQQVEQKQAPAAPARQTRGLLEAATKSAARAIGSELGRQILRGVLGSIFGGGRRR